MKIKKTSLLAIFVAVALVAGITIAFATSATSEDIPIQTEQPLNEHTVIMGDLTFSIYESKEDITTKLNEAGLGYDEYYLDDGDKKGNYDSRYAVGTSLQVYFLDDLCVRLRLGSGDSGEMPQTARSIHQLNTYSQMIEQYGNAFETYTYSGREVYTIYRYSIDDCIYEFGIPGENSDSIYNVDVYLPSQSPIYDYGAEVEK